MNMQISISPKDFIINVPSEAHGHVQSDFVLHGLKLKNDAPENITLMDISFDLKSLGKIVKKINYTGEALESLVAVFNETFCLTSTYGLGLYFGSVTFWNQSNFAKSIAMEPNEETGIFNECFIVVHHSIIDKLAITVTYLKNMQEYKDSLEVPIIQYNNKNEYIFPVKGAWSTCGNYNNLLDHRPHYSMEFAIDMAQYNSEFKLMYKEDMSNEDFVAYGSDILAIADGEVVDFYNSYSRISPWDWNERKILIEEYGFLPAQCGNYIVIKHANDECSFYGHLIPDSLTVEKGDIVKQGQVIGKLGHTGLSNCPHLHFQLMDGPNFLGSRGLPCSFSNLRDVTGMKIGMITEDNLIVHAE